MTLSELTEMPIGSSAPMDTLIFRVKELYGKKFFYPVNVAATLACRLARQKSLTKAQVEILKALGLKIEVKKVKVIEEDGEIEEFKGGDK